MSGRVAGYAPIADYAAIGDGRTVALVARDGSVDWLCLPDLDSPWVFGRLLDSERGGSFALAPAEPFESERRYQPDSNVLETTFRTAAGTVRVTDALTLADDTWLSPMRELARRIDGVAGEVRMRWRVEPRFDHGSRAARISKRAGRFVATDGRAALAISSFGAGEPRAGPAAVVGEVDVRGGDTALLSLTGAFGEPLVLPGRRDTEHRLRATEEFWPRWANGTLTYEGPWRDQVLRSMLALKLLVHAPSGAIVAAPTTSLPEWVGGPRNWDYRYAWPRDAAYTVFAFLEVGCSAEARSFFWWQAHATALSRPRLHPLYEIDGGPPPRERELDLPGYRGSRPVRIGNAAHDQLQLDVYGPVLEAIWLYAQEVGDLDVESGRAIAKIADWVARNWQRADAGIWEVRSDASNFVQSKAMCWVALDRACKLAGRGWIPDRSARWRRAAEDIRSWIHEHGWDAEKRSYVRSPEHGSDLDASLLTLCLFDFDGHDDRAVSSTVEAVRRELSDGALVRRYDGGNDGLEGPEGAFLPCSFWLAGALAKCGRIDEATELMDELVGYANDVGLYSEEIGPGRELLGNFPQALCHLGFVNAACAISRVGGA